MQNKKDDLRNDEEYNDNGCNIVLLLLEFALSLLVVVEFDLYLMGIFDEAELEVGDIFLLDNLIEFLEQMPLGHLGLDLLYDLTNEDYLSLQVLLLEFEEGLQRLFVFPLSDVEQNQQKDIEQRANA
jgi:hypothetical protein